MIWQFSVGIWWNIMEKLPMHFPIPLGGFAYQSTSAEANLSVFRAFCHINGMAGNKVMEMLKILSILFCRNNYSSYCHASFVANQNSIYSVEIITVYTAIPVFCQSKFLFPFYLRHPKHQMSAWNVRMGHGILSVIVLVSPSN